jgi:hypothetical protein
MDVGYWMNQWYWMFFLGMNIQYPSISNIHLRNTNAIFCAILWWFCFEEKEIKVWTHRPYRFHMVTAETLRLPTLEILCCMDQLRPLNLAILRMGTWWHDDNPMGLRGRHLQI